MSWNQPPNGQAGMRQPPPVAYQPVNPSMPAMPPQNHVRPPINPHGPPPGGQFTRPMGPPPSFPPITSNPSQGDHIRTTYAPPPMPNGPPPRAPMNTRLPPPTSTHAGSFPPNSGKVLAY